MKQLTKSEVMKTIKFRLLATMITLAAVIITTTPTEAQRRSTSSERSRNERVLKSDDSRKRTVEKKNTTKNNNIRTNSSSKTIRQSTQVRRNPTSQKRSEPSTKNNRTVQINGRSNREIPIAADKSKRSVENRSQNQINRSSARNTSSQSTNNRSSSSNRRNNSYTGVTSNRSANIGRTGRGNNRTESTTILSRNNREKYRLDENDRRYTPSRNYRGSNSYWTERDRPAQMNYNRTDKKFYRDYDYVHYRHWDRRWENYRWNFNSWRDYYSNYNPYSYRYYRYYYYHPYYGHVIRRFINPPLVFVQNHINYYCYDGHFFRYHPGIGYILVDMPYGMVFDYIPVDYERVYINGYLYFRVGNLFFEYDNIGFHLIHYPERYFSINVSFFNGGFVF